jgi:hypothetical protein
MGNQPRALGLRELRLMTLNPQSAAVCRRIAAQVAALNASDENDALSWIEAISEFNEPDASGDTLSSCVQAP